MFGKEKCRMLRQIRQKIAEENDIALVTKECTHKGECRGTCPACEGELRYLEKELARRQALGKKVAVAALAAGISFGSAGCAMDSLTDLTRDLFSRAKPAIEDTLVPDLAGLIVPDPEPDMLMGEIEYTEEYSEPGEAENHE